MSLLDRGDDTLDLVLRGHLHVEQLLLAMIEEWAITPRHIIEAKLGFSQKLSLVRALNLHHPNEPIWHALSALNTLRNDFAHRLSSDHRDRKIQTFIDSTLADFPQSEADPDEHHDVRGKLLGCFAYLMASLEAMKKEYASRAAIVKLTGERAAMLSTPRGDAA
ncbi:hypothetical protein V1318_03380 [Lysobacter sp. CCNWLW3]|uniref:hypothetical protein n=1 Tax=unclassified Lysobacter TaxID=2635362 RepID=UPI002FCEE425